MAAQQNRRLLVRFVAGAANQREADRARKLVVSDPEMARMYAELVLQSNSAIKDAVADARAKLRTARGLEQALAGFPWESGVAGKVPEPSQADPILEPRLPTWRWLLQIVNLLTVWTLFACGVAYLFCPVSPWVSPDRQLPAAAQVRVQVRGPRQLWPGLSHKFRVATTSPSGLPHPAQVRLRLTDQVGNLTFSSVRRTEHEQEWLEFDVPGLAVRGNSVLEARVEPDGGTPAQQSARLPCRNTAYMTLLTTDRNFYFPGDEIFVRSLTVAALDGCSYREHQLQFALLDQRRAGRGQAVNVVDKVTRVTSNGLAFGRLVLPTTLPQGNYDVIARNPAGQIAASRKRIRIELPSPPLRADTPRRRFVTLRMVPEGGVLIPEITNSIFVTAKDNQGRPAAIQVRIVDANLDSSSSPPGPAAQDPDMHLLTTNAKGQGRLPFMPKLGARYKLASKSEGGQSVRGRFPPIAQNYYHVLHVPQAVVNASQVRLMVRSRESGVPLSVTATCRGATVGRGEVELKSISRAVSGAQPQTGLYEAELVLPLAREASGLIELVLYDRRFEPPRAVASRRVFCRPRRRLLLDVRPAGDSDTNRLGFVVAVNDENGMPVNATVGVMVKSSECLLGPAADESSLPMHAQWLLGKSARNASHWPDQRQSKNAWEQEMELLLGTQVRSFGELPLGFWRRRGTAASAKSTSLLIDNGSEVKSRAQTIRRQSRLKRLRHVRQLGYTILAIAASAGGLMWLTRLYNATRDGHRWPARLRSSLTILGIVACLVLGLSWLGAFADVEGKIYPGFRFMAAFQPPSTDPDPADTPAGDVIRSKAPSLPAASSQSTHSATSDTPPVGIDLPPADANPSLDKFELAELYAQIDNAFIKGDRNRCGLLRKLIEARIASERRPPQPLSWSQRPTPGRLLYWHPAIQPERASDVRFEFAVPRRVRQVELTIEAHHEGRFGFLRTKFFAEGN